MTYQKWTDAKERRARVVDYVEDYIREHGHVPSLAQIGEECDIAPRNAAYHLSQAVKTGAINIDGVPRGNELYAPVIEARRARIPGVILEFQDQHLRAPSASEIADVLGCKKASALADLKALTKRGTLLLLPPTYAVRQPTTQEQ